MLCFFFHCSLLILYFICIFLLLLPTWRIKLMMMMMIKASQHQRLTVDQMQENRGAY